MWYSFHFLVKMWYRSQMRRVYRWLVIGVLGMLWIVGTQPAGSQSPFTAAYTSYSASGRIDHLTVADINHDGIDEFALVADSLSVSLVSADGSELWDTPFQTPDPVIQLTTFASNGTSNTEQAIALGTTTELILLDYQGNEQWRRIMRTAPITMTTIDADNDGRQELLVGLQSGQLRLYNGSGDVIWQYTGSAPPAENAEPRLTVGDLDNDGRDEIVFSYFTRRTFSELAIINGDRTVRWARPVSGLINVVALARFDETATWDIAVGTAGGSLHLVDAMNNRQRWYRTPFVGKQITAIVPVNLPDGPALVVGTNSGGVVAYSEIGQRYWTSVLADTPDQRVVSIDANPTQPAGSQPFALIVTIAGVLDDTNTLPNPAEDSPIDEGDAPPPEDNTSDDLPTITEPARAILLDGDGRPLPELNPSASSAGLTQFVDVNRDGKLELLWGRFRDMAVA